MSYTYKLLALDYGGVYSFEYNPAAQDIIMKESFGRVPLAKEYFIIHPLNSLLAANKIDSQEYVQRVAEVLHVPTPNYKVFEKATVSATFDPSPAMTTFVKEMRSTGLHISLLSDMFLFEVNKTKPWGRYDGFDYVSLSAEIGASKLEPEAFMHTLRYFDIKPNEMLFVDDKKSNIETAEQLEIDCFWADKERYSDCTDLIADIRKKLIRSS